MENNLFHLSDPEVFKFWSNLAVTDPMRFEEERKKAIEKVILSTSSEQQERGRRLQWRIDIERAKASNPLSAAIRLNRMMWNFVCSPTGLIAAGQLLVKSIDGNTFTKDEAPFLKKYDAKILPFTAKK